MSWGAQGGSSLSSTFVMRRMGRSDGIGSVFAADIAESARLVRLHALRAGSRASRFFWWPGRPSTDSAASEARRNGKELSRCDPSAADLTDAHLTRSPFDFQRPTDGVPGLRASPTCRRHRTVTQGQDGQHPGTCLQLHRVCACNGRRLRPGSRPAPDSVAEPNPCEQPDTLGST